MLTYVNYHFSSFSAFPQLHVSLLIDSSLVDPVANVERPSCHSGSSGPSPMWFQKSWLWDTDWVGSRARISWFRILIWDTDLAHDLFQNVPNLAPKLGSDCPSRYLLCSFRITCLPSSPAASLALPRTGSTTRVVRSVGGTVSCALPSDH